MDTKTEQQQPLLEQEKSSQQAAVQSQPRPEPIVEISSFQGQTPPQTPLLQIASSLLPPKQQKTKTQKAIRKTFKGTAVLSKLLPTGSVLTFQVLSPVLTQQGECKTSDSQRLTVALVGLCAISCFLLSFTDSFRDERGKVRYGVATFNGLWVIDSSVKLPAEDAAKYMLKFIDFVHAIVSILIFAAVAMFDQNVVKCFNPTPSEGAKQVLTMLPFGIGVVGSLLFVAFPSRRHGVGSPLSRN